MDFQPVESSNIAALAFSGEGMFVKFKNNSVYRYRGVKQELFEQVRGAASVGRTFNELIKSNPTDYPFERVST